MATSSTFKTRLWKAVEAGFCFSGFLFILVAFAAATPK